MRLRQEQLNDHLQQQLAPVYFISSDEPLQSMETADAIRKAANNRGYIERDILTVEGQFNWGLLQAASNSLSLFTKQKILDLRMPSGKPGQQGSKAIQAYANNIPSDKILMIQSGKIDYGSRNAAWMKALDKVGVIIQIWDLSPANTLTWIARRMRQHGLRATQEVVHLLTERVEGNLLAAAQEIQKLQILFGEGKIDEQQVVESVTDSTRFSVYDLADAILLADKKRVQHILKVLQEEDTAVVLLLWSITDLARKLHQLGLGNASLINRLPRQKQLLYRSANQRLQGMDWIKLWDDLVEIDWKIKGVGQEPSKQENRIWDMFLQVSLRLCI